MAAEGGVLRQVNVGGIVGICDAARAVPFRRDLYGMVARRDTAAAVAMGVVIRSLGREGSIRFAA